MTPFDIAVVVLFVVCAVLGFWRGLVSEVLALAAWGLALVLALLFSGQLAHSMVFVEGVWLRQGIAFVAIVVVTLLAGGAIRWVMRELLKAAGLRVADRVLGAGFGLVKGLVIAMLVVLFGGLTGISQAAWWREAAFTPPLQAAVLASRPWLPEAVAKRVRFD